MSLNNSRERIGHSPIITDNSVLRSVVDQPTIARQGEIYAEGVNEAIEIYKETLRSKGIDQYGIDKNVDRVIEGIKKPHEGEQRARKFIKLAHEMSIINATSEEKKSGLILFPQVL